MNIQVLAVLGGWLSNSSPCLIRAITAYRSLDLTGVVVPVRREPTKRARWLTATEQARLIQRYQSGATVYVLASEFSVSRATVAKHLKAAGIQMRGGPLSQHEIQQAIQLYATGLSTAAVGKQLSRDHAAIWRALRAAGVQLRDTHGRERSS